jgi:hypothetical protein
MPRKPREGPAMMGYRTTSFNRPSRIQFSVCCVTVLLLQSVVCPTAESEPQSINGVTFSDKLGGFILEKATGEGSMDDPFVLVERMTDSNGGTL